jgi:crotonobetainyl-CoA:carnitine CoA-transferase CaiB-like acyl-CoA transferase
LTEILKGIRVVELGTMITAPLVGLILGDFGADVIKVERPDGGDPFRSFRGGLYSPHFIAFNRNKRSVELDLQTDAGKAALRALLAQADVLLDNYRSGVMERLGVL